MLAAREFTAEFLFALVKAEKETLALVESDLRALVVKHATETGEKKPAPGVEAKQKTTIEYNAGKAFEWAKETGIALILDEKAFEKIAFATNLEFVTKREEFTATIASDLPKALAEVEA